MGSSKKLLLAFITIGCALSLAEIPKGNHDTGDGDSAAKSESSKTKKRGESKPKDIAGCVSSVVEASLKALFPADDTTVREIQKLSAEIARRTPAEVDAEVKKLIAIAKNGKVDPVDLIAAVTQPEAGLDENQVHKLIKVATDDLKSKPAQATYVSNFQSALAAVGNNDGTGMRDTIQRALSAGQNAKTGFTAAKLHVLLHAPDLKMLNRNAMETAMREILDTTSQPALAAELNLDESLKGLSPEQRAELAKLLRSYQKLEFAGDTDKGHELAEELAKFSIKNGVTGALPALVSKRKANYCLFAGGDPNKLAEIDKELAEMVEEISDKYGYKHIEADKLGPALRELGRQAVDSKQFEKAAQALIAEMITGKNKMNLADVMFFAQQANLFPEKAKMAKFAELVKSHLNGAGSAGVDFSKVALKDQQAFNSEMGKIRAEADPAKVKELTTKLFKKAKSLGLSEENVLAHLTSDAFLVGENTKLAENAGSLVPKRQAIHQAHALMEVQEYAGGKEGLKAIDKLAKLDVLGGLGAVEDGGDETAPQKTSTWKTLADRVLAKAKTDEKVRDALAKMSEEEYWMGPRAEYIKKHLPPGNKVAQRMDGGIEAEGETKMTADGKPSTTAMGTTENPARTPATGDQAKTGKTGGGLFTGIVNYYLGQNQKTVPTEPTGTKRETSGETPKNEPTLAPELPESDELPLAEPERSRVMTSLNNCVECHKNNPKSPFQFDGKGRKQFLKTLSDNSSSPADSLARMVAKAEVESGQSHAQSLALAEFLGLPLDDNQYRKYLAEEQAEHEKKEREKSVKTGNTETQPTPYNPGNTAMNRVVPQGALPGVIPGYTGTGATTPPNLGTGFNQAPTVGMDVGGGRVLAKPADTDSSTGVVNFVIGEDGRPLVVSPGEGIAAPLHLPTKGQYPNFSLVKTDKGYFFTGQNGQISPTAQPVKMGEPINGSFFGLDSDKHVAMVYDGPGKVRFVPSGAAARNSESFKVMAERRQHAGDGLAPPLKIPKVTQPTAFALRDEAVKLAGYQPGNFDEHATEFKAVSLVRPTSGGTPQPIVIDATRQKSNTTTNTVENRGYAFVGNLPAKLLAAPTAEALAKNGDKVIPGSKSSLYVDVENQQGAERLWVAKDVSGTYLIRVPLLKDSSGKVLGPDHEGITRVEKLLNGENVVQGLAFFASTPQTPFADEKTRGDIKDPRNILLNEYAREVAAPATPVTPAVENQTPQAAPREAARPQIRVQPAQPRAAQPPQGFFNVRAQRREERREARGGGGFFFR